MKTTASVAETLEHLCAIFPEREEVIRNVGVALVARQHALLLGEPGTAKSRVARTMFQVCQGTLNYFEVLLHAFSTPEELFGPPALSALQNDRYKRNTVGYAPEAHIILLDEVFKANMGVSNTLLTLLNERKFHNDGAVHDTPLMTCIGASNELPESPQLSAFWDRFLIRLTVNAIAEDDNFDRMMKNPAPTADMVPTRMDIATEQKAATQVKVSNPTFDCIRALRKEMRASGRRISDRRWKESLMLVQAKAHLAGRTSSEPEDAEVFEHVLWNTPDERAVISGIVQKIISPDAAIALKELDAAKDLFRRIPDPTHVDPGVFLGQIGGTITDLMKIKKRIAALPKSPKVDNALKQVEDMRAKAATLAMSATGADMGAST